MAQPPKYSILDLPPELRLQIYEHIFQHQMISTMGVRDSALPGSWTSRLPLQTPGILTACRTTYHEALPTARQKTDFSYSLRMWSTAPMCKSSVPGTHLLGRVTSDLAVFFPDLRYEIWSLCVSIRMTLIHLDFCRHVSELDIVFGGYCPFEADMDEIVGLLKAIRCPGKVRIWDVTHANFRPHAVTKLIELGHFLGA
jgi:hypothetical protein